MKPIPVVWSDLEIAFERNGPEVDSYLRGSTGEVMTILDGDEEGAAWRRAVEEDPDGFVRIEPCSSREQYRWMEYFVTTVVDPDLQRRLLIAIDGKGAFRRFKDVLLSHPAERERWFNYRAQWLRWHINRWVARVQLPVVEPPPWGDLEPPPTVEPLPRPPPAREALGDAVRQRVHDAVEILPAGELPAALVFLEFLRERGSSEISSAKVRLDTNLRRVAASRAAAARAGGEEAAQRAGEEEAESLTAARAESAE